MVFNSIFNNFSDILWRSVLLMEENGVPGENHWPTGTASHCQTLYRYGHYVSQPSWDKHNTTYFEFYSLSHDNMYNVMFDFRVKSKHWIQAHICHWWKALIAQVDINSNTWYLWPRLPWCSPLHYMQYSCPPSYKAIPSAIIKWHDKRGDLSCRGIIW